jgi:hypothetical protein
MYTSVRPQAEVGGVRQYVRLRLASGVDTGREHDVQFFQESLTLNLNYKAIIEKWESSPFTEGKRLDIKLEDCWRHDDYSYRDMLRAVAAGRRGCRDTGRIGRNWRTRLFCKFQISQTVGDQWVIY